MHPFYTNEQYRLLICIHILIVIFGVDWFSGSSICAAKPNSKQYNLDAAKRRYWYCNELENLTGDNTPMMQNNTDMSNTSLAEGLQAEQNTTEMTMNQTGEGAQTAMNQTGEGAQAA